MADEIKKRYDTALAVAIWFVLNIAMSNIVKWTYVHGTLITADGKQIKYKFPMFITVLHMTASWIMCGSYMQFVTGWPENTLNFRQQVKQIMPFAICYALSIACNNMSLVLIYPSLNQMLASVGPVVTVLVARTFTGVRSNNWTHGSLLAISIGLMVCSGWEANLHVLGMVLAVLATVMRALKSVIQQKILEEKMDSVLLLFYMAPFAGFWILLASLVGEGVEPMKLLIDSQTSGTSMCLALLALGAANACFLNLANFWVTKCTSAVTLQVLGNVKSALNILVSVLIFHNKLRLIQMFGVGICMAGTWVYNKKGGKLPAQEYSPPVESQIIGAPADDTEQTHIAVAPEKVDSAKLAEDVEMSPCLDTDTLEDTHRK